MLGPGLSLNSRSIKMPYDNQNPLGSQWRQPRIFTEFTKRSRPPPTPPLSYNDPGSHEQSFGETEEQRSRHLFLKANGNGGVKPGIRASHPWPRIPRCDGSLLGLLFPGQQRDNPGRGLRSRLSRAASSGSPSRGRR